MWIVNKKIDLLFILFPGILVIPLLLLITEENPAFLIIAFAITVLLDKGHVYTTIWRTVFRKNDQQIVMFAIPLLIFMILFGWLHIGIPLFFAMIVYTTVFHNIRQFYGFTRWYQKKAKLFTQAPTRFVYALTILPFLIFHFRDIPQFEMYERGEELLFINSQIGYQILLGIYILTIILLLFYLIKNHNKKALAINLSILSAAIMYGYAFIFGQTTLQILAPLMVTHASSYLVAMSKSLKKLTYNTYLLPIIIILTTAILFGVSDFFFEQQYLTEISLAQLSIHLKLLVALFFTPLISHYIYDMMIWKSSNKDFQKILS